MPAPISPIDFGDLEPLQVEVTYRKILYILREASVDAAMKYREAALRGVTINPTSGKAERMDNSGLFDPEPVLVSRCLYVAGDNGKLVLDCLGNPDQSFLVPLSSILAWPYALQKKLQKTVHEMSPSLKETDTEAPKEPQKDTPASSS